MTFKNIYVSEQIIKYVRANNVQNLFSYSIVITFAVVFAKIMLSTSKPPVTDIFGILSFQMLGITVSRNYQGKIILQGLVS